MYKHLFLHLLIFFSVSLLAQDKGTEVDILYLKNNEVYRGKIIEDALGLVSILIEKDGEETTKKFQHFEIKKIERASRQNIEGSEISVSIESQQVDVNVGQVEAITSQSQVKLDQISVNTSPGQPFTQGQVTVQRGRTKTDIIEDPFTPIPYISRHVRVWTRQIRGFRGFTQVEYSVGIGNHSNNSLALSQSIGYQFNPIFYLGTGVSYRLSLNRESSLPVFINPRFNLTDKNDWNPFWDLKAGYSPVEGKGAFASTTFGLGFVMGKRRQFAINTGLTYSFQKAKFNKRDGETGERNSMKEDYHQIGIVAGFEF